MDDMSSVGAHLVLTTEALRLFSLPPRGFFFFLSWWCFGTIDLGGHFFFGDGNRTARMCLDDTNPSVTSAALNATEVLLGPLARDGEDEEGAMQGLSWVDYQARTHALCLRCFSLSDGMEGIPPHSPTHATRTNTLCCSSRNT